MKHFLISVMALCIVGCTSVEVSEVNVEKPPISAIKKHRSSQHDSIEIIESKGHIIFSKLPENSRLRRVGITIGDSIISVNDLFVSKNNIETAKQVLKDYQLEISILGKGTAFLKGYEIIKPF